MEGLYMSLKTEIALLLDDADAKSVEVVSKANLAEQAMIDKEAAEDAYTEAIDKLVEKLETLKADVSEI